jgi:hypothetical protein
VIPLVLMIALGGAAPSAVDGDRVMAAVRAALAPALPFPNTDPEGVVPLDGQTAASWMVRPLQPGDREIEILANPLNPVHQARATRAMRQIDAAIESAQRRAEAQYERAIAEAKRTGRSQDVDGVTLSDEGLAGARIDAESHLTVSVSFGEPAYRFTIAAAEAPQPNRQVAIPGAVVLAVPAHVYRDAAGDERLCEAEMHVYFGVAAPEVRRGEGASYEVTAAGTPSAGGTLGSLVVRMRGNEGLIAELLSKADWKAVGELLR